MGNHVSKPTERTPSRPERPPARDFYVRLAARFLKSPSISPEAKVLRSILAAFADAKTRRTYVKGETVQGILGWGRRKREQAQAELCRTGWLRLEWKRGSRGRWARRTYVLCETPPLLNFSAAVKPSSLSVTTVRSGHQIPQPLTSTSKNKVLVERS